MLHFTRLFGQRRPLLLELGSDVDLHLPDHRHLLLLGVKLPLELVHFSHLLIELFLGGVHPLDDLERLLLQGLELGHGLVVLGLELDGVGLGLLGVLLQLGNLLLGVLDLGDLLRHVGFGGRDARLERSDQLALLLERRAADVLDVLLEPGDLVADRTTLLLELR